MACCCESCRCVKLRVKVVIMDLDLTLWDGDQLYKGTLEVLQYLNDRCIKVYCVSANAFPKTICENLNINQYFHRIYSSRDTTKSLIIKNKIIRRYPWLYSHELMAFDDQMEELILYQQAHDSSINLYHVDHKTGIDFAEVKKLI
jgi:soluble P-type ATPase